MTKKHGQVLTNWKKIYSFLDKIFRMLRSIDKNVTKDGTG